MSNIHSLRYSISVISSKILLPRDEIGRTVVAKHYLLGLPAVYARVVGSLTKSIRMGTIVLSPSINYNTVVPV